MTTSNLLHYLSKIVAWARRTKTPTWVKPPGLPDLYSTHMEYLAEIFKIKGRINTVLEFGTGNYSTGLLIANSDKCISIEMQSADWYERVVGRFSDSKNWEHHLCVGPMKWTDINLPENIGFGFVDGHGESRPECVNYLMEKKCPIIVSHDTEEPGYGWLRISDNKAYDKIIFRKYENWTTLWTTDMAVYDHFVREKIS